MIDVTVKFAALAALAWMLTIRVTPRNAANAHRLWLAVMGSPALWFLGTAVLPPIAYVRARHSAWPDFMTAPTPDTLSGALTIYMVVAGLLLARTMAGVVSVQRLIRRSRALEEPDLERLRLLCSHAPIEIREAHLLVPVTAGFAKPVIILPEAWRSLTPLALTAILRHEAAHVMRRDCTIALAVAFVEAAFWFNPAVWLAGSRVRWFAEMACDAEAARAMEGDEYASALLALAAGWKGARRPVYAITAGAETGVGRRIRLLLDDMEHGSRHRLVLPIAAVALVIGMPLSAALRIEGFPPASPAVDSGPSHDLLHQLRHRH